MKSEIKSSILEQINALRREIESLPINRGGKRRGIKRDLRVRILECQRQAQLTLTEFSQAIGVSEAALGKWKYKEKQFNSEDSFKRIKIESNSSFRSHIEEELTLEAPRGIRITGLNVQQVAELLRSL